MSAPKNDLLERLSNKFRGGGLWLNWDCPDQSLPALPVRGEDVEKKEEKARPFHCSCMGTR